jgi:hypothetical protein
VQKKTELILTLEDLENFKERFIKDSKFRRQYTTNTALVEFADSEANRIREKAGQLPNNHFRRDKIKNL